MADRWPRRHPQAGHRDAAERLLQPLRNPTVRAFEEAVAELEGAEDALAFASGMGAIASTIFALCSAGDHIVIQRQIYAGTIALVQGPCARLGIEHTAVDGTDPGALAAAVRPGRTDARHRRDAVQPPPRPRRPRRARRHPAARSR